jgi:hypothetical protein
VQLVSRTYTTVVTIATAPATASAKCRTSACRSAGSRSSSRVPCVTCGTKSFHGNRSFGFGALGTCDTSTSRAETRYVPASNQKVQRTPTHAISTPATSGPPAASKSTATRDSDTARVYSRGPTTSGIVASNVGVKNAVTALIAKISA